VTARLLPIGGLKGVFGRFRSSVFRFEAQQEYAAPDEAAIVDAFLAGRPRPLDPGKDEWTSMIRAGRWGGRVFHRVHVVTEPLTDYLRFELTWGYEPNVAAGEDIRVVALAAGEPWPADLPRHDFWLFDAAELYTVHYHPDTGAWLGVEPMPDPGDVARACRWRETAWQLGVPWSRYVGERPELARHLSS
jgi:hypothetical protein